ncbi:hypothetical protein COU36_03315 [Candidatus Micrarchaeota archaeon CG10_big_fil_rev_8_21_14_0_10_59_7]|nr:MAG: hypothetical protein COU36_03315 [Candidatus Micrarchaeota archaeon CG10_big_fil_rev_8_21_14_0_10_59_7]
MSSRLFVRIRHSRGRIEIPFERLRTPFVLGTRGHLVLDESVLGKDIAAFVAAEHVSLEAGADETLIIRVLDKKNGTVLNGVPIQAQARIYPHGEDVVNYLHLGPYAKIGLQLLRR